MLFGGARVVTHDSCCRFTAAELLAMSDTGNGRGAAGAATSSRTTNLPQWLEMEYDWSWGSRGTMLHPGILLVKLHLEPVLRAPGLNSSFSDSESSGGESERESESDLEWQQLPPGVEQARKYAQLPLPSQPQGQGQGSNQGQGQGANPGRALFLSDCAMPSARYQVQVNCYSGRELPAADSNGLLDPYLTVELNGQTKRTKHVRQTRDPHWFEALVFDDVELPKDSQFASPLMVRPAPAIRAPHTILLLVAYAPHTRALKTYVHLIRTHAPTHAHYSHSTMHTIPALPCTLFPLYYARTLFPLYQVRLCDFDRIGSDDECGYIHIPLVSRLQVQSLAQIHY
jgi:hypothetical protein